MSYSLKKKTLPVSEAQGLALATQSHVFDSPLIHALIKCLAVIKYALNKSVFQMHKSNVNVILATLPAVKPCFFFFNRWS